MMKQCHYQGNTLVVALHVILKPSLHLRFRLHDRSKPVFINPITQQLRHMLYYKRIVAVDLFIV